VTNVITDNSQQAIAIDFRDELFLPPDAVERTHVLETIEQIASENVPVIFIEGESGCGATTLMTQFCLHVQKQCFHLFVKPASRFAYSLDYLRLLLAEQFASYLGRDLSTEHAVDEADYEALLLAVRKKRGKDPLYFVIDGLQQIPQSEKSHIQSILTDVLPMGTQGSRFFITGNQHYFEALVPKVKSKCYQVQKLSRVESQALLHGIQVSDAQMDGLLTLCNGLPGRLASVKRMVRNQKDASLLLNANLTEYPDFISVELETITRLSEVQKLAIALVTFSRYPLTLSSILELADANSEDAQVIGQTCSFVRLNDDPPYCDFTSETYRRYAERLLESYRNDAISLQIESLAKNPNSADAIQFLPSYYQSQNQQQAILDLLDPDHYSRLLDTTKSIAALRSRAAMGARSAADLNQAVGIFQFALQKSIFSSVVSARAFKSQVAALVALGQQDRALDVATQAPTTELRLRMMAEYARSMVEAGLGLNDQVAESIRELSERVDPVQMGDELESLAENVAFFDIDLAISILDKASARSGDDKDRDGAIFRLTLATSNRPEVTSAIAARTGAQITNDRQRSLIAFIASYFGGVTLNHVTTVAEKLVADRRIFFLRCVLSGPELGNCAIEVIEYALDQVVGNASYLPKVRDLSDFATPLAYLSASSERVSALVKRFEAQLGLAESSSASVHLIDLRVKLALGVANFDQSSAKNRIVETYFHVQKIESPEIKAQCLAIVLRGLRRIDLDGEIEKSEGLGEVLHADLLECLAELLANTASHYEVVRGALTVIAEYDVSAAILAADGLNTQIARDKAYACIAEAMMGSPIDQCPSSLLDTIIGKMSRSARKDGALLSVIRACSRSKYKIDWAPELVLIIPRLESPGGMAEAVVLLMEVYRSAANAIPSVLVHYLDEAEVKISSWVFRAEILYRASAAIANFNAQSSSELYERAELVRSEFAMNSDSAVETVGLCLSLLLRCARVLIKFGVFEPAYVTRFARLCDALPDICLRIAYFAHLATLAACEKKLDLAGSILQVHCHPLVYENAQCVETVREMQRLIFAPSYLTRGKIAFRCLDGLSFEERSYSILALCDTIIQRVPEGDAGEGEFESATINFVDADSVIDLIAEIESDFMLASAIRHLVSALLSKSSRNMVTVQQRAAMKVALMEIAKRRLPQSGGISHEGYLVEIEAYLARLSESSRNVWEELSERASNIPNLADRVLVKMEVATSMPSKLHSLVRDTLSESRHEINRIPSSYDRFGRLELFVESTKTIDPGMAKAALRDALESTFEFDSQHAAVQSRRKLLDLAEQVDPKSLDDFVNSIDDDPARAQAKRELLRQAKVQKVRRKISSAKHEASGSDTDVDILPSAAWKNVASLVSGRAVPLIPELLSSYVAACGEWNLSRAFPVLSWYLENLSRKVMRAEDVLAKVVPLWEALLLSSELATNVIEKTGSRSTRLLFNGAGVASGMVVRRGSGSRDAMEFLGEWMRENDPRCSGDMILCDPYFSPRDVDFLRLVLSECPQRKLIVLTGRKALGALREGAFEEAWMAVMDQDPPDVEIIGISDPGDDRSPIHDRWLFLGEAGLRIGTSVGGLGSRLSEISLVEPARVLELRRLMSQYAAKAREVAGKRVTYLSFFL